MSVWDGRDLPFPVLLDLPDPRLGPDDDPIATGSTIGSYGIVGFPTTLLIDQEGKLVGRYTEVKQLEESIRRLLGSEGKRVTE